MTGTVASLRRGLITTPLFNAYRRALPPLSRTEQEALEAGTVWWDADLFSGRPDWQKFLAAPKPQLTAAEQAFLDGPVEALCQMLDDWQIVHELRDMPPEVWEFAKKHRFFGLIIPEEYGGLGFSALAQSAVNLKLCTRSMSTAVTVMVPNSLGPAELLLHYGTPEQRDYYLPRLARGEELPCFALTGPYAGSDAAAMRDIGTVCYGDYNGQRTLGIRLNFEKRYITLAPVATLIGLAFKLHDPEHLLGEEEERGITLALIPANTPGIRSGRRHYPAKQAFQNGPLSGRDVFIPLDAVIGGQAGVGRGWSMLMDCLAAGRAISLPSTATGGAKLCARVSGAYARIRKQFKVPVGRFEGVQEALARIAGHAYTLEAARAITATAIDHGAKPSVLSAIMKYHATERMRAVINDAMDIHGGRGICDGPSNYLSNGYQGLPVMITVEGANILTRSLIIFGQGAMRCHPYLYQELKAAQDPDPIQGLVAFERALFSHIRHTLGNAGRALWQNLSGARWSKAPVAGPTADYFRQINRVSVSFALLADCALLLLGGALKRRESLSGRFADILSELYLASCVLKRFEDEGRPAADLPLVQWSLQHSLHTCEQRIGEILDNFPSRPLAWLLRRALLPWGLRCRKPDDRLTAQCANLLLAPSAARDRLTAGIYVSFDPEDITGRLEYALEKVLSAEAIERKLAAAGHTGSLKAAVQAGLIDDMEAQQVIEAERATRYAIDVDDFDPAALSARRPRPAESSVAAQAG